MFLKGKSNAKRKPGRYKCKKCKAISKERDKLGKPKNIKKKK